MWTLKGLISITVFSIETVWPEGFEWKSLDFFPNP